MSDDTRDLLLKVLDIVTTIKEEHGQRLDGIDRRLDGIDRKLDEHGRKLDEHGRKLDEHGLRLDGIDRKLDEHGRKLDEHSLSLDELGRTASVHTQRLTAIEVEQRQIKSMIGGLVVKEVARLDGRIDQLAQDVALLRRAG